MKVTLYNPDQLPQSIPPAGFSLPDSSTGFSEVTALIARELRCELDLVDVLDSGKDFVAYTIFDSGGEHNSTGIAEVMKWSDHPEAYQGDGEDDQLCGPMLLVTRK